MRNPVLSSLGVLAIMVALLIQPVFGLEHALAQAAVEAVEAEAPWAPDTGDTTWLLVCTALVLAMTVPGVALFYGGMARKKNALNTIMMSFVILCLISVQWILWGYSLAFAPDVG
ncbi:MAG TPA: ammonium transporter, partial [Nitrospirales bacterium]|nr:ammonium transporter [Nitrospirales bacterium]